MGAEPDIALRVKLHIDDGILGEWGVGGVVEGLREVGVVEQPLRSRHPKGVVGVHCESGGIAVVIALADDLARRAVEHAERVLTAVVINGEP